MNALHQDPEVRRWDDSIQVIGSPEPLIPRLLAQVSLLGSAAVTESPDARPRTLVFGVGHHPDPEPVKTALATVPANARLLSLSWIGTHPDAKSERLRLSWELEEQLRAAGRPLIALRLAPLLGPSTPLWTHLCARPPLPRRGRDLLQPVLERDVVTTLERALASQVRWDGWFELVGPEPLTLGELSELATRFRPKAVPASGWEPSPQVLAEQRLGDPGPWAEHFDIRAGRVTESVSSWAM